ncbi:PDZ domain-containing protein [Fimbriiglobus ruber]|uniref:PDZ domain-containing protein n=1 Tax=Fimbriiglobus ruber TaxID=1908690 RepID=A0A225DFV2_9BACT|nr:PDZ domain-containing protein [Fimbriiglobus ruber]OWK36039.1 hypothetical protein FRUB_08602 [Fimbriiglobus ruber]
MKAVLLALLLAPSAPMPAVEFYVAPNGDDAKSGSKEQPFATVHQAQIAARRARSQGHPVTVFLRGGTHYLATPLVFGPEDSGTKEAPVTYRAYEKETPVVSGGVKLNLTWEAFRDGISRAKVPDGFATDQLFVSGARQHLARYPNFNPDERIYNGFAADAVSPARAKRWADPRGGFIHAMHASEWGGYHFVITGKKDDGTVTYEGGWQNNRPSAMHGRFRFVENIFEELDAPGEWFLDRKTNTLYFYPPAGVQLATAQIEAVRLRHLVEFRGTAEAPVRFVNLRGLTFRHAARTFMDNKEPLVRSDWTTYRGGAVFYTGTEDCSLEDSFLDQVGGNAVFVNHYNRRLTVRGCHIAEAGGNGVAFVGDRDAARVPRDWKDTSQTLATLDREPGPKTNNYPADCVVDDCLIYRTGRVEKQTAPVQIELARGITVRHCSLYDVPRAGINIGDGCWGGHVIEFCDVFDTVKETGDHGSFNSWGRDRFWDLAGLNLNDDQTWEAQKQLPVLDATQTTVIRNNRWRCDHGWDIDLDDGSTNYHITNNLCLHGGLKNREGFFRTVENNIIVNNGFHPHVWYKHSQDVVRHNILGTDHYLPAGGMPATPWGREMDHNLVHQPGLTTPAPATKMARQSKRDEHSLVADALFVDPDRGDYRVKADSPALKLGFKNFPMDQFGVRKPDLKAIARTPELPKVRGSNAPTVLAVHYWQGMTVKDLEGEEYSAFGVSKEAGGVQVLSGTKSGIETGDLIQVVNGKPVKTFADLMRRQNEAAGEPLEVGIVRKQQPKTVRVTAYTYVTVDTGPPTAGTVPVRAITTKPATFNDPVATLSDGRLTEGYGPVFGNGTVGGAYKVDLGKAIDIAEIKTWSFNQNKNRGPQRFVLFGSTAARDPGWDANTFAPIIEVDTTHIPVDKFQVTRVRRAGDPSVGTFRWLMWVVTPVTEKGENTAFQEFQILAKP